MKDEMMNRTEQGVEFSAADSTMGYVVLFVLLAVAGVGLGWLWPGSPAEWLRPWERAQWTHPEAIAYAMVVALVGAVVLMTGAFISDRGRRHRLCFDSARQITEVREWWRGLCVEVSFPFRYFASFEVHQPVGHERRWELGGALKNGSYWRLLRRGNAEELDELSEGLNAELNFGGGDPEAELETPERIEYRRSEGQLDVGWPERELPATRVCSMLAALFFAAAVTVPAVAVFEGKYGWFFALLAAGVALFLPALVGQGKSVASKVSLLLWLAVVIAAVGWLGAHLVYFVLATVGVAIFGRSAADVAARLRRRPIHSVRIDGEGRIYEDGELIVDDGEPVDAASLEAAVVDITEMRPVQMELLWEGGAQMNLARNLGEASAEDVDREPLELEMPGLSLFERIWVSLVVDREIRRHDGN